MSPALHNADTAMMKRMPSNKIQASSSGAHQPSQIITMPDLKCFNCESSNNLTKWNINLLIQSFINPYSDNSHDPNLYATSTVASVRSLSSFPHCLTLASALSASTF